LLMAHGVDRDDRIRLVIVTGLSGAGKTQALRALEDMGFFCVDNLPPSLLPKFGQLCVESGGEIRDIALVIDIRGGQFFDSLADALAEVERMGLQPRILFLEATDEVLVRRFKETRRRHPLAPQARVLEGLRMERARLELLKERAQFIIDTTDLTPAQLRREVEEIFAGGAREGRLVITVVSFGFKYGLPLDADLVFDVRFLPNPHYVEELRELPGTDEAVAKYVMSRGISRAFIRRLQRFTEFLLPHYLNEGKTQLTIAVGCTGGRHRSVVVAERLGEQLRRTKHTVLIEHRDLDKRSGEG